MLFEGEVMEFSLKRIYLMISKDVIWFRWHRTREGWSIKRTPQLFSERMGKTITKPLFFGWRLQKLDRPDVKFESNCEDIAKEFAELRRGLNQCTKNVHTTVQTLPIDLGIKL